MAEKKKVREAANFFLKEQLLVSERFRERKDIVSVLLDPDEQYTVKDVDALVNNYMKGKVK